MAVHVHKLLRLGIPLSIITLAMASPSSASAEAAWWQLTSGARPTYLHAGTAADQTFDVTVSGTVGQKFFLANLTTAQIEKEELEIEGRPQYTELAVGASASEIQARLEEVYGAGNVEVKGGPGEPAGSEPYVVEFMNALGDQPVSLNGELGKELGYTTKVAIDSVTQGRPDGEIVVTAENLGDTSASGVIAPIELDDELPVGFKAVGISGWKAGPNAAADFPVQLACSSKSEVDEGKLSCKWPGIVLPYEEIEVRIAVLVEPDAVPGEANRASVSGGESEGSTVTDPLTINSAATPFGLEDYALTNEEEGGAPSTQAGAHPFQQTTTIDLNEGIDASPLNVKFKVQPAESPKDVHIQWPAGLIGNPSSVPRCSLGEFLKVKASGEENECAPDTAVGVVVVTIDERAAVGAATFTLPVFNLEPNHGEPARFGFNVVAGRSPVVIDTAVRTGGDYGVTIDTDNITQTAGFLSAKVTIWGTPGDARHDNARGWGCLYTAREASFPHAPCDASEEQHPLPFLVLPTSCLGPLQSTVEADSWTEPGRFVEPADQAALPALDGCDRLPFNASITVTPDAQTASTPTGLAVEVHVPQEANESSGGLASSNIRSITVTLPEGVEVNPAAADGLQACSEPQIGYLPGESRPPAQLRFTSGLPAPFCPEASKIATVRIKTPLLPNPLEGAVYLASQGANPFNSLIAMYLVAEDPVSGTLVKLPGLVSLNEATGQITSTFENTPQVAFEDAELHFFGGDRAPLATPAHCGTYATNAVFTPWSGTPSVSTQSSFQVTSGPDGTPCPSSPLPFAPSLASGTTNDEAANFSPLTTTISRDDGNQDIERVQLRMPPGISGILTGIPLCPEAEANAGSCSQASLIGHTIVSVGLGGDPYTVTGGEVFLTEKYEGAPFGLSIVNPAVAGPFNLGKVIVRAKIEIDPHTAQLTVTTGAIPHILDGIPLQIKHVNVTIDRPSFTFNPTHCSPQAITATISSVAEQASAALSTPFQTVNCALLRFPPKFAVSTSGKTSKKYGASLTAKLSYPTSAAGTLTNIARVKVDLPKQLPSRLTTLQKACLAAVFEANPANCPSNSVVGHATVTTPLLPVPLTGPAYFVSHGGEAFPSLTMVLQGYGITIDLVGSTLIRKGITSTTFKTVPDVPFNHFELTLPEGQYSALAANGNLCKSKLNMPTAFVAQNGQEIHQTAKITVTNCPKPKKAKRTKAKHKHTKH